MQNSRWVWVTSSGGMPYTAAATIRCTSEPARQRVDQSGILREVRDAPQLDLVVVGYQEVAAFGRHEGPPELLAQLGAHRDVVQVRAVRGDAPGPGHGLPERRVDAAVGLDLGEQALPVGGAELLHLAVRRAARR